MTLFYLKRSIKYCTIDLFFYNKYRVNISTVTDNYWLIIKMMRYSTEPRFRKYVKGYGFLSFARNFDNKFGKKLMDTATKTGRDAGKIASKRDVQKTAEATGDLIENKIADKITSIG